jgi:hypothetical protein
MTVDFKALLERERDTVITFEVTRGSFDIPADLLEAAIDDEAADYELRVLFARSLPEQVPGSVLNTSRRLNKDGTATIMWRRIITHVHEV